MLKNRILYLILMLFSPLLLLCCGENTINPFEDEKSIYSIYGSLSMDNNVHYIRVRKTDTPLLADSSAGIDGTVTFTDLETGTSTVLRDTIVNFSGNYTRNFILEQELKPDRSYEIRAERQDGAFSRSSFTTPQRTAVDLESNFTEIECETPITFRYKNIREPELIQMDVGITHNGELNWAPMEIVGQLRYNSNGDEMSVSMSPRNLMVEVFPPILPDVPNFNNYLLFPTVSCASLENKEIRIRYRHFGAEWHTGKPRMGQINMESGIIENGLGFIGAYRTGEFRFFIGEELNP